MQTNTKELEKNINQQELNSELEEKVKEVVTDYWHVFCENVFYWTIRGF